MSKGKRLTSMLMTVRVSIGIPIIHALVSAIGTKSVKQ